MVGAGAGELVVDDEGVDVASVVLTRLVIDGDVAGIEILVAPSPFVKAMTPALSVLATA